MNFPIAPPLLTLYSNVDQPLIEQIVQGLRQLIDERALRAGSRVPSIRDFAKRHGISTFTVVEAYDRLVAIGYLESRRSSGFYVVDRRALPYDVAGAHHMERAIDVVWLMRHLQDDGAQVRAGSGWLPHEWLDGSGIQKALRTVAKQRGTHLTNYGVAAGFLPLRQQLTIKLAELGIHAPATQVMLTNGVSHAIDLVARFLLRPHDTVLVDDPGYFTLFGYLKTLGVTLLPVPRLPNGPDIQQLEQLVREHRPKAYFINSVLHNPTGTSLSHAVAYRILQLAEQEQFYIIEDDVYGDFHAGHALRLAALDQLERVIYLASFSKTVSASLRVGFIAGARGLIESLSDLKMLTALSTSEMNERVLFELLTTGSFRKHLERVRGRLAEKMQAVIPRLEAMGLQLFAQPEGGLFLWVKFPTVHDTSSLATEAVKHGLVLAPGSLFRPHGQPSPWIRLNISACDDQAFFALLDKVLLAGKTQPCEHD